MGASPATLKTLEGALRRSLAVAANGDSASRPMSHGRQWISIQGHHMSRRYSEAGLRKRRVQSTFESVLSTMLYIGSREDLF